MLVRARCARWLRTTQSQPIDVLLREFLDEFHVEPAPAQRQRMLIDEPAASGNPRADAYLAAVAEHLAFRYALDVPEWALAETRLLHAPWFPAGIESLKAITLVESPTAFRRRLIFVDHDPLSRPRRRDRTRAGEPSASSDEPLSAAPSVTASNRGGERDAPAR